MKNNLSDDQTAKANRIGLLEREVSLLHACIAILVFVIFGSVLIVITAADSTSSNALSPACQLSSILEPSCGILWGAYAPNNLSQIEGVMGRQFDVFSDYYDFSTGSSGQFPNKTDQSLMAGNRILDAVWQSQVYSTQSVISWQQIANGDEDTTVLIPEAQHLKSLGSTKVFLTFDPGMDDTSAYPTAQYGNSTNYVAAYQHIFDVFQTQGVTNVVWVWSPSGDTGTFTQQAGFYPGDSYVDWIGYTAFNSYQCGSDTTWQSPFTTFDGFYQFVGNGGLDKGAESKPLMLSEYGSHDDAADPIANDSDWYAQVQGALYSLPDIKAALEFDTASSCDTTLTTSADISGYKTSGQSSIITGDTTSSTTTGSLTPPTVALLSPSTGQTVHGTITITGTASDATAVDGVELYLDDKLIDTDLKPPYDFSLNTTNYPDGNHVIYLVAYDASSNRAQTSAVALVFDNGNAAAKSTSTSANAFTLPPNGFSIDTPESKSPIPVSGILLVVPTVKGATLKVYIDGKLQSGTSVDTAKLTDGTHTLTITQGRTSKTYKIAVHNTLPIAARNLAYTHPVATASSGVSLIVVIVLIVLMFRAMVKRRVIDASHYKLLGK